MDKHYRRLNTDLDSLLKEDINVEAVKDLIDVG